MVHQEVSTFYTLFSAFLSALIYYGTTTTKPAMVIVAAAPLHRDTMPIEPDGYKEMLKHAHAAGFKQAINTEIESLQAKQTWQEVSPNHALTVGKILIPTRWVFKYKFDDQGYFIKYKAQLVARGDL